MTDDLDIELVADRLSDSFIELTVQLVAITEHRLTSMANTLRRVSDSLGGMPAGEFNADIETRLRSLDVLSRELVEQLCGYLDMTIEDITEENNDRHPNTGANV